MKTKNTVTSTQAKAIARLLNKMADHGFKLDLTSNGEFTSCYVVNDWIGAYKHMTSGSKASIVVLNPKGDSLRMFLEFDECRDSMLSDFSSQNVFLKSLARELLEPLRKRAVLS